MKTHIKNNLEFIIVIGTIFAWCVNTYHWQKEHDQRQQKFDKEYELKFKEYELKLEEYRLKVGTMQRGAIE